MMRSIWTGAISFGLVSIPIKLYSTTVHRKGSFHLYNQKTKNRVRYLRVDEKTREEVAYDAIVKGLVHDEQLYTFTTEELEALKPAKSDAIVVERFVDAHTIDSLYYEKHYFVGPQKNNRPYFLLRDELSANAKVAVCRMVFREKEYTVTISAYQNVLLLSLLNYPDELRSPRELPNITEEPSLKQTEHELAQQLIAKLSAEEPHLEEFHDTFEEKLRARLEGEKIPEEVPQIQTGTLAEALQASLEA